jgi:DNA-directed RNA polymerase subunit RPC12/RpoP
MDIIFNCPNCDQELSVDGAGAGTEIDCPSCGAKITIPEKSVEGVPAAPPADGAAVHHASAMAASAAAKVEMRLKVPLRDQPSESLLKKPATPLAALAKGHDKQIRIRTIRHANCVESGRDRFEEKATDFLAEVGEANIIGVHIINYEHFDVGLQKVMVDFGVLVVYRG